jgi:hypothetical protein
MRNSEASKLCGVMLESFYGSPFFVPQNTQQPKQETTEFAVPEETK